MVDKISNARKKELEQPDPFLEALQGYANAYTKYRKQILMGVCAVVAVVVVFSGTVYSIKRSEEKASGFLAQTLSLYSDVDPVKGYETVKDDVAEFLESYPNTAAATQAGFGLPRSHSRRLNLRKPMKCILPPWTISRATKLWKISCWHPWVAPARPWSAMMRLKPGLGKSQMARVPS